MDVEHDPENTIPNKNDPEWKQSRRDTQSRMDAISYGHNPECLPNLQLCIPQQLFQREMLIIKVFA